MRNVALATNWFYFIWSNEYINASATDLKLLHRELWVWTQVYLNERPDNKWSRPLYSPATYSTNYSHHRSEFRVNPPNVSAAHQEVTRREMIPNDTLHLSTEAPDPMAVVWTAAVVQDRRPATHTMLWLVRLSHAVLWLVRLSRAVLWLVRLSRAALWLVKSFSTSRPTCHMIRWWEFEPQTGGNSAFEPVILNQIKIY